MPTKLPLEQIPLAKVYISFAVHGKKYADIRAKTKPIHTGLAGAAEVLDPMDVGNEWGDKPIDSAPKGTFERDMRMVMGADIIMIDMDGLGFGTPFEMGVAWYLDKPIVVYNLPEWFKGHPFVEAFDFVEKDQASAIRRVLWLANLYDWYMQNNPLPEGITGLWSNVPRSIYIASRVIRPDFVKSRRLGGK